MEDEAVGRFGRMDKVVPGVSCGVGCRFVTEASDTLPPSQEMRGEVSRLGDLLPLIMSRCVLKIGEPVMRALVNKLVDRMVAVMLPMLLDQLIMVLEEMIKADLNKDGRIGFGSDENG